MKTPKQKEKEKRNKLKNSIRVIGKIPEKKKKGSTGELELFKKIAEERSRMGYVLAKHITSDSDVIGKLIRLEDITPTNFSHIKPKGMYPELRLDPNNIEIVSRAYHEWQHTGQVAQTNYIN